MADDSAKLAREFIDVPWDELRSARVHKRMLEALRDGADIDDDYADGAELALDDDASVRAFEDAGDDIAARDDAARDDAACDGAACDDAAREEAEVEDAAIIASLVRPAGLRGPLRWWLFAAALVAAAAVVFMVVRPDATEQSTAATWKVASTLRFADGSRSLLDGGAQVEVVRDSAASVLVKQAAGKVRYEVTPRKQRQFVVTAGGVEVTVVGTVFEVTVGERRVGVRVQRGKVRVRHGERVVELVAGEHIAMDAAVPLGGKPLGAVVPPRDRPQPGDPRTAAKSEPSAKAIAGVAAVGSGGGATAAASAAEMLRAADTARASGDLGEAARVLRRLIAQHPRDRRLTLALFTLGKVERQRGQHLQAAQAFEACGTALRGDALAAAANEWLLAGDAARARAAASRYVQHFPDGVHAHAMRGIVH